MFKVASLAGMVIDFYDDPDFWKMDDVCRLVDKGLLLPHESLGMIPDH